MLAPPHKLLGGPGPPPPPPPLFLRLCKSSRVAKPRYLWLEFNSEHAMLLQRLTNVVQTSFGQRWVDVVLTSRVHNWHRASFCLRYCIKSVKSMIENQFIQTSSLKQPDP